MKYQYKEENVGDRGRISSSPVDLFGELHVALVDASGGCIHLSIFTCLLIENRHITHGGRRHSNQFTPQVMLGEDDEETLPMFEVKPGEGKMIKRRPLLVVYLLFHTLPAKNR